jgi:hypothetical protein
LESFAFALDSSVDGFADSARAVFGIKDFMELFPDLSIVSRLRKFNRSLACVKPGDSRWGGLGGYHRQTHSAAHSGIHRDGLAVCQASGARQPSVFTGAPHGPGGPPKGMKAMWGEL